MLNGLKQHYYHLIANEQPYNSRFLMITLEADRLFAGLGEHEGFHQKRNYHLQSKNVTYTVDDYENFFVNMTGNKSCSDTGSEEDTKRVVRFEY